MVTQSHEFRTLLNRIEDVELRYRRLARQNHGMKFALIVLPLSALVAGASFQNRDISARAVTAERLVIQDDQGRSRAVIECKEKRASFEMYDPSGARRVSINVFDNGTASMYQHYPGGKMFSFGWMTPGSGGKAVPNFAFRGPDGVVYASLTGKTDASPPSFEVFGKEPAQVKQPGKRGGTRP